jgi:elongation factor P hydroxylase
MDNNDLITPVEHDQIVSIVFDECERIYNMDYRRDMPLYALPWCLCTTCGEKHQCVCSVIDMSAECHQCRFRRRVREECERLKADKLKRRAEQLKDFAEI